MDTPRGRAFVSYSYDDEDRLKELQACVPPETRLAPFPPIDMPPDQMVSERLIREIRASDCLIYLDTQHSRASRWVTMEIDYARRNHLPVFRYSLEGALTLDARSPLQLPVFPSFSHQDDSRVLKILRYMREEHGFDLWLDGEDLSIDKDMNEALDSALQTRLSHGGYTLLFLSRGSVSSEWCASEVERTIKTYPQQVLIAALDDPASFDNSPIWINERVIVPLYTPSPHVVDYRRVDDVITWLYWLIQQRGDRPDNDDAGRSPPPTRT